MIFIKIVLMTSWWFGIEWDMNVSRDTILEIKYSFLKEEFIILAMCTAFDWYKLFS